MDIITILTWLAVAISAIVLLKRPVKKFLEFVDLLRFQISCIQYANSKGEFRPTPGIVEFETILLQFVPYYKNLSYKGRGKFLNRLNRFLYSKYFEGMAGLEVTLEMQTLISATAVQLTFGLKHYLFPDYNIIYIYPEKFLYEPTHQYHKGNASTSDFISLSWKDFMEGIEKEKDKINLGIHELTHALEFSYLFGEEYDSLFADYYGSWEDNIADEIENLSVHPESILRKYAKKDPHEFFAVATECFFEMPDELINENPSLFNNLCLLLNQDPRNSHSDYCLNSGLSETSGIERNLFNRQWHWSLTLILTGIFLGPVLIIILMFFHYISVLQIISLIVLVAFIGSFLQYNYFKRTYWVGFLHFISYNLFGFGMLISSAILGINLLYTSGKTNTDYFQISRYVDYNPDLSLASIIICKLKIVDIADVPDIPNEVLEMAKNMEIRNTEFIYDCNETKLLIKEELFVTRPPFLRYSFQKGLLGIPVIIKTELLEKIPLSQPTQELNL